jgi:hypothetical protein
MLVWTVCAFRKPGMSEDEFHRYMSETHAPLVREALARHGITRYTMVSLILSILRRRSPIPETFANQKKTLQTHSTTATRALMGQVMDAQFINDAPYDMITQIRFPAIQCFVNFRNDPYYKEKVMADHDVFTDPERV